MLFCKRKRKHIVHLFLIISLSLFLLLFQLHAVNAIKSQAEKGPIDYYTHEARYTLAEERLLKQQIEFNVINLIVFKIHGLNNEKSEYQVKVLDCDCISQVKNKIIDVVFKNVPKSKRPEMNNVILEHNYMLNQTYSLKRNNTQIANANGTMLQLNGQLKTQQPIYGQNLILEDDDDTTQTIDNWRQINTVKHYQLMNNSIITMRILNEQPYTSDRLNDQSLSYTIYDNYTDSQTGHLYECINSDITTNLLIKNRQYFDQTLVNKYSVNQNQNLPDMLDIQQNLQSLSDSSEELNNRKNLNNSIYGYNSQASTMMSNRLLKQQQMPLLGGGSSNGSTKQFTLGNSKRAPTSKNTINSSYNVYYTLNNKKTSGSNTLMRTNDQIEATRHFHLSKDLDQLDNSINNSTSSTLRKTIKSRADDLTQNKKLIKEIYLTRLLTTKGTLQKYIDDFFNSVLVCDNETPIVVKWLFDLLDDAVEMHGIQDPEIIYAWKCNR